jgi:prevent-host-death family protein
MWRDCSPLRAAHNTLSSQLMEPGQLLAVQGTSSDVLLDAYVSMLQFHYPELARGAVLKIPEIRPISDLARDARALVERARERQEPIVITQRGRDAVVLVPIELYRKLERERRHHLISPRLVNPEDAEHFKVTMTIVEPTAEQSSAGL